MNSIKTALDLIKEGWKSQRIRLVNTKMTSNDFELLKETLINNSAVKCVELCLCKLNENDIIEFAHEMSKFSLVGLQLAHVGLTEKGAFALSAGIQECSLKKLDISFNRLSAKGTGAFADALRDCGLESLLLGNNNMGLDGAIYLANVLLNVSTTLTTLDISRNQIGSKGLIAISEALVKTSIDTLMCDGNQIRFDGIKSLCKSLSVCPLMSVLSLEANRLRDDSIIELSSVLRYTKMEKLCLHENEITDAGIEVLSVAIRNLPTMRILDLRRNPHLTDKSVDTLKRDLKTHRKMFKIHLDDCDGISLQKRTELENMVLALQSERARTMTILCAVKMFPRYGNIIIPIELFRNLANMLG